MKNLQILIAVIAPLKYIKQTQGSSLCWSIWLAWVLVPPCGHSFSFPQRHFAVLLPESVVGEGLGSQPTAEGYSGWRKGREA